MYKSYLSFNYFCSVPIQTNEQDKVFHSYINVFEGWVSADIKQLLDEAEQNIVILFVANKKQLFADAEGRREQITIFCENRVQ